MVALKSTASRCPIPTSLHQYPSSNLSEGLIGSNERPGAVEQLQLLVWRVDVSCSGSENHRVSSTPAHLHTHSAPCSPKTRSPVHNGPTAEPSSIKSAATTTQAQSTAPSPATEASSRARRAG